MEPSKILDLNSDAAYLIGKGSYAQATKILRSVLKGLLADFGADSHEHNCASSVSDLQQRIRIETVSCHDSNSPKCISSMDTSHFTMYSKAIRIIEHGGALCSNSTYPALCSPLDCKHLLSVAVLYNLALAYHSIGLRNMRMQHETLNRALRLYQMCLDVLGSVDGEFPSFVETFFTMAAVNNMGNIYSQFYQYQEAQHCIGMLCQILMDFRDNGFGLSLGPDDYLHFHMNVILLHGQDFLCAPAA